VPRRSIVLGVLGGIAAGKSLAAELLAGPDGVVLDADRFAREELDSPEGRRRLVERYGPTALAPDGSPDREALAQRAFGDPGERAWLEGWIHPAVRVRIGSELSAARARGVACIVLDVPLLFEHDARHHLVAACDALVFVDASAEARERRARQSRGWPAGEVARREAVQVALDEKRARADHVLTNEGPRAALEAQVRRVRAALGLA
jgi:dephospho-CoA kinase